MLDGSFLQMFFTTYRANQIKLDISLSKLRLLLLTVSISSLTVAFFRSSTISCRTYSQSMQPGFLGPRTEIEAGRRRSDGSACKPAKLLVWMALLSS